MKTLSSSLITKRQWLLKFTQQWRVSGINVARTGIMKNDISFKFDLLIYGSHFYADNWQMLDIKL